MKAVIADRRAGPCEPGNDNRGKTMDEGCTPDGIYLFFSRRRSEPPGGGWPHVAAGDVYWVDAAVIERLRPAAEAGDGQ